MFDILNYAAALVQYFLYNIYAQLARNAQTATITL